MTANARALLSTLPTVQITTVDGPFDVPVLMRCGDQFVITPSTGNTAHRGVYTLTHLGTGWRFTEHDNMAALLALHRRIAHLDWTGTADQITERLRPVMRPILAAWRKEWQA
jgi:hypothetical protein